MTESHNCKLTKVSDIYQYFDDLFEQDVDADTLFASGYVRGFIALVATDFGSEEQLISDELLKGVSTKLLNAKKELSPQDFAIVNNFWLALQSEQLK